MSKIVFSGSPSNGSSHTWRSRRRFNYSTSKGGWQATGAKPPRPTASAAADFGDLFVVTYQNSAASGNAA